VFEVKVLIRCYRFAHFPNIIRTEEWACSNAEQRKETLELPITKYTSAVTGKPVYGIQM